MAYKKINYSASSINSKLARDTGQDVELKGLSETIDGLINDCENTKDYPEYL